MINMALEVSHDAINTPQVAFPECGAMSQGYIGYHLQQQIQEELIKRNMRKNCVTVLTQVVVDKKDKAFLNPTAWHTVHLASHHVGHKHTNKQYHTLSQT